MPLELDESGILPVAVHDTDLTEIGGVFGQFQKSKRRMNLFAKLTEYVTLLQRAEIRGWLIVDGSFVMACVDEPEDIDVVLVLPSDWDFTANLRPFQYNLVSKRDVKRKFPIEVFPAIAGSETEQYWTTFFQQVNIKWYESHGFKTGAQKGLVRIAL
jgi:hypothetical protein